MFCGGRGRIKLDIVAPAVHSGILSSSISRIDNCFVNPPGDSSQQCFRTTADTNTNSSQTSFDDRYAWISMTSGAAAMVSGSAALFIQDFRANNGGREPLPSTVKVHFIHTARDLDDSTNEANMSAKSRYAHTQRQRNKMPFVDKNGAYATLCRQLPLCQLPLFECTFPCNRLYVH